MNNIRLKTYKDWCVEYQYYKNNYNGRNHISMLYINGLLPIRTLSKYVRYLVNKCYKIKD